MPVARVAADPAEVAAGKHLPLVAAKALAQVRAVRGARGLQAAEVAESAGPAVAGKAVAVRPVPEVVLLVLAPNELDLARYIFSYRRKANAPN
jgi:hypothetical protein